MRIEEYKGYSFREDGVVFSKDGKQLKIREHKGKLEVKISEDGKRKLNTRLRAKTDKNTINKKEITKTIKENKSKIDDMQM